jgi:PAS domain S-box-containing protein
MGHDDAGAGGAALSGAAPASARRPASPTPGSPIWRIVARRELRATILQWSTGLLCALLGAQMLIVPHQLSSQAYDIVRPQILVWGAATLLAGMTMLVVAATGRSRWLVLAAHAGVAIVLLLLAGVFAAAGGWIGAAIFGALGIATLAAPGLARAPRGAAGASDLLTTALGVAFGLVGVVMLAFPEQLGAPGFDDMRADPVRHGLIFLFCGALVVGTQLAARAHWWMRWLAALLLVGVVLLPLLARALAQQVWTGITLYGLIGPAVIATAWLGPFLERIDPRSLRVRLAVTLAVSSALALILVVAVDANREESSLRAQAGASQRTLATALAHDVADYVELHESAARVLAAGPSLLDRSPDEQAAWLRAHATTYPNVVGFALFDAAGVQRARSDGRPLAQSADPSWFQRVRVTGRPVRIVARSTTIQRPTFAYAAPIRDPDGTFRGVVTATVESSRIAEQLSRVVANPSQRAYLVDGQGHTIAHPDVTLVASFADLSALQPVAALLGSDARADSLVYAAERDEWLAGVARVPNLDWGVVVEQPTSVALESVRAGRERAFGALILVACLAAVIGAVAAGWLTAPLAVLSLAVRRLADGASDVRLGTSSITEVARLAGAFAEMRQRLAARTREHERSEAALRESEERLRLALQAGRMGTWDWNVRTHELSWDSSLEEIHGLAPGSFDGRFETFVSLVHPEDRERAVAAIRTALPAGDELEVEFRVAWPDGSIHWISGLGRAYRDEAGEPIRMVGIGLEVTERRRTEEVQRLLAEAGSRLVSSLDYETTLRGIAQLVATTMADYCIVEVQDEDGARSVEVAHADPARAAHARQLVSRLDDAKVSNGPSDDESGGQGSEQRDGVGQRVWSDRSVLVPVVAELPATDGLDGALSDGLAPATASGPEAGPDAGPGPAAPVAAYGRLARALGVRSLICVPLLARERTIGALTLMAAESGRRYGPNDLALAEALAARAALAADNARLYSEAQAAIRARDEFLSIASHELRTPVTGIKGYAQLLLRAQQHDRLEAARLTRSLRAIDETTDRLATLTQDLLDVSRIRLGQLPLRLQEIDLDELVRRVSQRFSEQVPAGLAIVVDIQSAIPSIQGDADRLEQVLTNLLENAIKYSPNGGTVRLELVRVDDEIRLSVRDEGIGLPSGATESIFRPFGRAPNAAQRNLPGMGLGLYICRNIVERHGGRITAGSAGEDLGTTIEIMLPCRTTPDAGAPAVPSASETFPPVTVPGQATVMR